MTGRQSALDERLLYVLTDELKQPFLQIARHAELPVSPFTDTLATINSIAEMSLKLIDGFLLSVDHKRQQTLQLEPVSVSSLLYDIAQQLKPMATLQDYELDIDICGKYRPVMAHSTSLHAAFVLLGYSLIAANPPEGQGRRLVLAAHRSPKGLVTGLFNNQPGVTTDMFRRGRALYGQARQALPAISNGPGAGIFVADSLLESMATPLRLARHRSLTGLAATFIPSKQLQLVR